MSSNVLPSSLYSQELHLRAHPASCHRWSGCHHEPAHEPPVQRTLIFSLSSPRREEGGRWGGLGSKRTRLAFTEELIISKQRVTTAVLLLRAAGISGGHPPGGCGPSREKSGIYSFSSSEHPQEGQLLSAFYRYRKSDKAFLTCTGPQSQQMTALEYTSNLSCFWFENNQYIIIYIFEHELNCN